MARPPETLTEKDMNMSSKELVVELRIPLPADEFEQAEMLLKGKAAIDAIKGAMPEGLDYTLKHETINRRASPAAGNGAAKPRQRGAAETQAAAAGAQ